MPIESQGKFDAVANEKRLRWDHENLSRPTGARQSKAYRDEVAREIAALESEKQPEVRG